MAARRNATSTSAGILRPDELARHANVVRTPCDPALAPWVENHWTLTWDLPGDSSFASQTLPHPTFTLSTELGHPRSGVGDERTVVTGVVTRRFDVTLAGAGWVHGVKFRPGGFAALCGLAARPLADRTVPASELLPAEVVAAMASLESGTPPTDAAQVADAALLALLPREADPAYETVLSLVDDMLDDRSLVQVTQVLERHGLARRPVERLFAHYVGVSPKWVLARYRMHDVVSELDGGYDGSLADLAATYGWYDQAHFGRDFLRLVGVTPSTYRS